MNKIFLTLIFLLSFFGANLSDANAVIVLFRSSYDKTLIEACFEGKLIFSKKITTDHSINAAASFEIEGDRGRLSIHSPETGMYIDYKLVPQGGKIVEVFYSNKGFKIVQTDNSLLLN